MKSNVQNWINLHNNEYFIHHKLYGDYRLFGSDLTTIQQHDINLSKDMTVLVIGSGYGRESALISPHVKKIYGIEVSPKILNESITFTKLHTCDNFVPVLYQDYKKVIQDRSIDLIYSYLVFQHVTKDIVRDYVKHLKSKLKQDGIFFCQFFREKGGCMDAPIKDIEPRVTWLYDEIDLLFRKNGYTITMLSSKHLDKEMTAAHIWVKACLSN